MKEFKKNIKLVFTPDEASVKEVERELKKIQDAVSLSDEEQKQIKELKLAQQELNQLNALMSQYAESTDEVSQKIVKELQEQIKEHEDFLGITEQRQKEIAEDALEKLKEENEELKESIEGLVKDKLKSIGKEFLDGVKKVFTDGLKELSNLLSYSRLSNQQTRELAFTYGFSSSQAYGYSQAMSALGFTSEEDLFYATSQEIELFKEAFQKYSDKYQKLYDEGTFEKLLEYQVEMAEFEQDMKLEVADFFMQNKELIKGGMKAMLTTAEALLKVVSFLFGTDNAPNRSTAVSDVISNYSNKKVTNVSIDNTFNGIDASQRQNLTRLGTLTTQQLIAALK